MVSQVGALRRHIALIGFMGAGKTTIGREVARLTERPFVDVDEEIVARHGSIADLFQAGEPGFRRIEEEIAAEVLARPHPGVIALGGGAVTSQATRERLKRSAFTVWIPVDEDAAWQRAEGSGRPLARDRAEFARLHEARTPVYERAADAIAREVDDVLLRSLHVVFAPSRLSRSLALGTQPIALVADARAARLHELRIPGVVSAHHVPGGEETKTIVVAERLWRELGVRRDGMVVAFGGGTTTDLGGFVAATYMRGVPWIAIPTTLVGQVDAAIGGKTGVDFADAKNLVGAFHFPQTVVIDPKLLTTLPEPERRNGMAEVVKTGLLAGRPLWDLPEQAMVRACAAFKCAVVLSDPYEQGRRAILNLGHTFAHALETASGYTLPHGDAVALGLLAALRLSGRPTDVVEELLAPEPVRVDRELAWAALQRDKKAMAGKARLVLLRAPGEPEYGVELPETEVGAALDMLIRD